jgi:hypothetical protein
MVIGQRTQMNAATSTSSFRRSSTAEYAPLIPPYAVLAHPNMDARAFALYVLALTPSRQVPPMLPLPATPAAMRAARRLR